VGSCGGRSHDIIKMNLIGPTSFVLLFKITACRAILRICWPKKDSYLRSNIIKCFSFIIIIACCLLGNLLQNIYCAMCNQYSAVLASDSKGPNIIGKKFEI